MQTESEIQQVFLKEIQSLIVLIKRSPWQAKKILPRLESIRDTARLLKFTQVYKLSFALDFLYKSIGDKKIAQSENIEKLLTSAADKLVPAFHGKLENSTLKSYVIFCDKAAAGEIFDEPIFGLTQAEPKQADDARQDYSLAGKKIEIPLTDVNTTLNAYETVLNQIYKVVNSVELLEEPDKTKEIIGEIQSIQNRIFKVHDSLMFQVRDNDFFMKNHSDLDGFFVFANSTKYFIAHDYIVDVTYENELEYIVEQGQRFLKMIEQDENGDDTDILIPVYSLSSIFPGMRKIDSAGVDTILIAEYMGQKVGIIVDSVQRFATLMKKSLPPAFKNFSFLEGLVIDEKYDMIPVLHIPEIMKRFRAQRAYDIKKFENQTKLKINRILVVDDSETTRQILDTILRMNAFDVDLAKDGINAMELIKKRQYDMVITDDEMPRMTGEILIDNIRRMENYEKVPVIAVSTNPVEKADAFMSKADFQRNALIQKIKELLYEQ